MTKMILRSPAKINLGLRILGRREDGYHDLLTLFQRISLYDTVALFPCESGIDYQGPRLTTDPAGNLCVKAAGMFFERFSISSGIEIILTKRIPTGAGLGGGSSNAAFTLLGLAQIFRTKNDSLLEEIAAELGSDVPFFLRNVQTALGQGRGGDLSDSNSLGLPDSAWIVVIWPGFQVSTASAYQRLDNDLTVSKINTNLEARELLEDRAAGGTTYINDFEKVIFAAHPDLKEACDRLLEGGASSAGLAGSGSSLFAVFDGEAQARAAASDWRPPWLSFVCRPY